MTDHDRQTLEWLRTHPAREYDCKCVAPERGGPCAGCVANALVPLLRAACYAHSQVADDRCWMDVAAVYAAAGLPLPDRRVGDKFEMIKNCVRFVEAHCEGGGWASYQELRQRHAALSEAVRDVHGVVSAALDLPGRPAGHTAEAIAHVASTVEAALRKEAEYGAH